MKKAPLGLPVGTVRAIITLMAVFAALFYSGVIIYIKTIRGIDVELPNFLLPLLGTVVGYYFGIRTADIPTTDTTKTTEIIPASIPYIPSGGTENEPEETKAG